MSFRTKGRSAYTHRLRLRTITVEQPVDNPCKSEPAAEPATPGRN